MAEIGKELMRLAVVRPAEAREEAERPLRIHLEPPEGTAADATRTATVDALADRFPDESSLAPDAQWAAWLDRLHQVILDADPGESLASVIGSALGESPTDIVANEDWAGRRIVANDAVLAAKSVSGFQPDHLVSAARRFRTMAVVEATVADPRVTARDARRRLQAPLQMPDVLARDARLDLDPPAGWVSPDDVQNQKLRDLEAAAERHREQIASLEASVDQLFAVPADDLLLAAEPIGDVNVEEVLEAERRSWEARRWLLRTDRAAVGEGLPGAPALVVSEEALARLPEEVRAAAADAGVDLTTMPLEDAIGALWQEQANAARALAALAPVRQPAQLLSVGGAQVTLPAAQVIPVSQPTFPQPAMINPILGEPSSAMMIDAHVYLASYGLADLKKSWETALGILDVQAVPLPPRLKPSGMLDLYIIRRHIAGYQRTEVSHVENILSGEERTRTHRRLTQLEQLTVFEQEKETEEERAFESTDKSEFEREVAKSVKEDFSAEAGLKVTVKYGPVTSVADGRVKYKKAGEESQKAVQRAASELVERATERVRQRVLSRRETRQREELEETNELRFDNTGGAATNVSGVYQWLEKVYRAEVFSYDVPRQVYDLIVPEPAAGVIEAAARTAAAGAPTGSATSLDPVEKLTDGPRDLNEQRIAELVNEYGVTESIPAMPRPKVGAVTITKSVDATVSDNFLAEGKTIPIPDGYRPAFAWLGMRVRSEGTNRALVAVEVANYSRRWQVDNLVIGDTTPRKQHFIDAFKLGDLPPTSGEIPVTVIADDFSNIAVSVMARFEPTAEAIWNWQNKAYSAIETAYRQRLQEWRDAEAAAGLDEEPATGPLFGRNPALNERLIRDELRRAAITIMLGGSPDRQLITHGTGSYPMIDLARLGAQGRVVRFVEQAFEWDNMTWVLYPYFWGRTATWTVKPLWQDVMQPRVALAFGRPPTLAYRG